MIDKSSQNERTFTEPYPRTDEEYRQWFINVLGLLKLQKGLAEGEDKDGFIDGRLSCERWRHALFLIKDQFKGMNLRWVWYAEGPVFFPDELERYTKGLIKWKWNENGECDNCLNRKMCYDKREQT